MASQTDNVLEGRTLTLNPITIVKDGVKAFVYHWKNKSINWPMAIYITLVHVAAVVGMMTIQQCKWQTLLLAFILWPIMGLGIMGGVHCLWAHRSYDAHWTARVFLMLFNSMANQGSIYHWSRDHRVHYKYLEINVDPHNATRGFFFAHMGWLYVKKHPEVGDIPACFTSFCFFSWSYDLSCSDLDGRWVHLGQLNHENMGINVFIVGLMGLYYVFTRRVLSSMSEKLSLRW